MFFEFLVDKKFVTKKDIVIAVMAQMESMPSLIRVLLDDNLLDSEKVFSLLTQSIHENRSFFDVLKDNGGVTEEDLQQILQRQNNKSASLGDLLVQEGAIERENFDKALREYSNQKDIFSKEVSKPTASAPAGISAAALESLKAVQGLDESMLSELEGSVKAPQFFMESDVTPVLTDVTDSVKENSATFQEYLDFYSEELQSELFVVANRYRLKGKKRDLENLYGKLVTILSLVKLNNFSFQIKILELHDNITGQILNGIMDDPESWRTCPSEMLEILWEFRKYLGEGKSEGQLLHDNKMKELYMKNLKTVMSYLKRSA